MAESVVGRHRKARHSSNDERWDRFSNLPDSIIHHIFSYLEMSDIGRIGTVSKRCRQMFISSPFLKFKTKCSYGGAPNLCKQFSEHVDNFLSQRIGLEIRCLSLHWDCYNHNCDNEANLTDKWINIAVSCQVQEIDLVLGVPLGLVLGVPLGSLDESLELDPMFELPHCMFSSKTLRVLKLDMEHKSLKVPTGVFVSLEELSLSTMSGSDTQNALEILLSTACPSLKRLTLEGLEDIKTLTINHPCLEELTLLGHLGAQYDLCNIDISTERLLVLCLDINDIFPEYKCEVKVNAPSLQDLMWTAVIANNVHLSQFKFLQNATLSVGTSVSSVEEATIRNRITELLQSVCCSRVLHIQSNVLETHFLHDRLTDVFDNLQRLGITVQGCLKDYHFAALATILLRSPNLEILSLTCSESWHQPRYARKLKLKSTKFLKQHEGFHDLLCPQLKAMEIELKGKGHQILVVENLLKIATGLKKLTVIYSEGNSKALSKIGLHKSKTASLPFEVKLVQQDFHIEDSNRIDLHQKAELAARKPSYHNFLSNEGWI